MILPENLTSRCMQANQGLSRVPRVDRLDKQWIHLFALVGALVSDTSNTQTIADIVITSIDICGLMNYIFEEEYLDQKTSGMHFYEHTLRRLCAVFGWAVYHFEHEDFYMSVEILARSVIMLEHLYGEEAVWNAALELLELRRVQSEIVHGPATT